MYCPIIKHFIFSSIEVHEIITEYIIYIKMFAANINGFLILSSPWLEMHLKCINYIRCIVLSEIFAAMDMTMVY